MHLALATGSTVAVSPAPWWAKLLVGILLIIIGSTLAWLTHTDRISFGEGFTDYAQYLMLVLVVAGVCVMLWGLGVNFNS